MTDNTKRKVQRGPLVSSRKVLSNEELEADTALPWKMIAAAVEEVTYDLISRVGYSNKMHIDVEPLPKEHPQAPGLMIAAKMRRP